MVIFLIISLLLSNALSTNKSKSLLYSRSVTLCLITISFLLINGLHINPLVNGIGIYGGLFNVTLISQSINIFIYLLTGVILTLSSFYPRKIYTSGIYNTSSYNILNSVKNISYDINSISNKTSKQFNIIEYSLIIVFVVTGAMFLMSTADLISIFLAIELQSYGLYILSTLYRDSEVSTNSGLTYFLLGGLSSCFILLGSALLYSNSGTTSLDNINIINSICDVKECTNSIYTASYMQLCIIIMVTGFLFKISAAPFHF
jgi:NADH-ubiquinone oxidoreductase chain 2